MNSRQLRLSGLHRFCTDEVHRTNGFFQKRFYDTLFRLSRKRQFASVAQLVEQGTENPRVGGSIPPGGTKYADVAHLVERHLAKVEVASSSLVIRSTSNRFGLSGSVFFILYIRARVIYNIIGFIEKQRKKGKNL